MVGVLVLPMARKLTPAVGIAEPGTATTSAAVTVTSAIATRPDTRRAPLFTLT
jgi:hypothetical protein